MATEYHNSKFTALDIEKYHKGQMSPAEMHALEKAALDDPFLADALDGYSTPGVNLAADMAELERRLREKTEQTRVIPIGKTGRTKFPFLRVAAMIAVLLVTGYLVTKFAFNKKEDSIAHVDNPVNNPATEQADSVKPELTIISPDSGQATAKSTRTTPRLGPVEDRIAKTPDNDGRADVVDVRTNAPAGNVPAPVTAQKDTQHLSDVAVINRSVTAEKQVKSDRDENDDLKAKQSAAQSRDIAAAKKAESVERAQALNTFRGRVTDESNNGVPFANVTTIQDNAGTYTDASGYFNFRSPDTALDVQVRSIGFENNISRLNRSAPTNRVVLEEDRSLNEMVISNSRPNTEARSRRNNVTIEEPEPADGWTNYDAYLANNLNVPDDYKTKPDPNPTVEVSFEVDRNGEPVNIRVERSLCKKCDSEAIRLIKEGPKWKRNANSRGRTTVTINF